MKDEPRITIFTPAFNRARTLPRTYESLRQQKYKNFIWLIIDDGSTDNTENLVKKWQLEETEFRIQYIYKENGGMHTAHNVAYENIETELNVCIDSDDCLAEDALINILDTWDKVRNFGYAGIIGLDSDLDGNVIGKEFPKNLKETTLGDYYAKGGKGDKKIVYRTDVINKYPSYPVFKGEKYVALAYKYRMIDKDYKLFVLNKILCKVEYQENGSTATMWSQYLSNPKGFIFWRKFCMQFPLSRKRLFIDCIHYVSESIIDHDKHFLHHSPKKIETLLALPFGLFLCILIRIKNSKKFK